MNNQIKYPEEIVIEHKGNTFVLSELLIEHAIEHGAVQLKYEGFTEFALYKKTTLNGYPFAELFYPTRCYNRKENSIQTMDLELQVREEVEKYITRGIKLQAKYPDGLFCKKYMSKKMAKNTSPEELNTDLFFFNYVKPEPTSWSHDERGEIKEREMYGQ